MKKLLSILLAIIMIVSTVPFAFAADEGKKITEYSQGDIIEFGYYPQGKVTDETTITALNGLCSVWKSYGYYYGTGTIDNGKMTASDYMRYTDVFYGGIKYRGVVFDSYRPAYTGYKKTGGTYQDNNGYDTGVVYWFKYEPIKWRVLSSATGMVMSETILDSQAYNNYVLKSGTDEYGNTAYWGNSSKEYYANNYEKSSIRQWLNNDFYNTAFSSEQQNLITETALKNSAYDEAYLKYNSADTKDKIYLLSWNDVTKSDYGFSSSNTEEDSYRKAQGSDYAKSQGLWVSTETGYRGNSAWLLRSPGSTSGYSCRAINYGSVKYNYNTYNTHHGVRPVLNLNTSSVICQTELTGTETSATHTPGEGADCTVGYICEICDKAITATEHTGGIATCTKQAECGVCGTAYGELAAHNTNGFVKHEDATCNATGVEGGTYCTVCDLGKAEAEKVIPVLGHDVVVDAYKAPTCTETGLTEGQHCTRCDDETVAQQEIPTVDHADEDNDGICDIGGEQITCNDCGRPVHEGFINEIICFFHMLINLITSFFTFTC